MAISRIDWKRKLTAFAVFTAVLSFLFGLSPARIRMASSDQFEDKWGTSGTMLVDVLGERTGGFGQPRDDGGILDVGGGNSIVLLASASGPLDSDGLLRAQKIDSSGARQWGENGVAVGSFNSAGNENYFQSASDGAGGAVVVWRSYGSHDVYAQRVKSDGTLGFEDGLSLATTGACHGFNALTDTQGKRFVVSDGAGGLIAVWRVYPGGGINICAQRINSSGERVWGDGALLLQSGSYQVPMIIDDGSGGAYISWIVNNPFPASNTSVYVTHLDADGNAAGGCSIGGDLIDTTSEYASQGLFSDGNGGALVAFITSSDIKVEHIGASCVVDPAWPVGGVLVSHIDSVAQKVMNSVFVEGTPDKILFATTGARANLISITDGSSVWGGAKEIVSGCTTCFNPVAVASGVDFIFAFIKNTSGPYAMKLVGATGAADPSYPAGGYLIGPVEGDVLAAISDGATGAIAVIGGQKNFYSQRIASNGSLLWSSDNLLSGEDFVYSILVNSHKTAIAPNGFSAVAWQKELRRGYSSPSFSSIYLQIINDSGSAVGPPNGLLVVDERNNQTLIDVVADDSGFVVGWIDYRDGTPDLYAAKFNNNGVAQWTESGVLFDANIGTSSLKMLSDGAGGAYITYADQNDSMFRLQRIDSSGAFAWGASGAEISGNYDGSSVNLVADGAGGVFVSWGYNADVYASRVSSSGIIQPGFANPGFLVAGSPQDEYTMGMVADGSGNAIIQFEYYNGNDNDIYAQKITGVATLLWPATGLPVVTADSDQWADSAYEIMASDNDGGAILLWPDGRGGGDNYFFAQRLDRNGVQQWGAAETAVVALALAGGEATVTVDSTAGFSSVAGAFMLNGSLVRYTGVTPTEFTGCTGVPTAVPGDRVSQNNGISIDNNGAAGNEFAVIDDGYGGAIFVLYNADGKWLNKYHVDRNGNALFGSPVVMTAGSNNAVLPRAVRSENRIFVAWRDSRNYHVINYYDIYGQLIMIPSASSAGGAPSSPPASAADPTTGKAVVPDINKATYYFENPGTATSFRLYEIAPDGTRTLRATVDDPTATSIVETGLKPNSKYDQRVVVAVNDRGESPDSPIYPSFVTLQAPAEGVSAASGKDATVTILALGGFNDLTTGESGIKFAVAGTEKTSNWIQTPSWTVAGLKTGETYKVEVTTRNQEGVIGSPRSFDVIPTPVPEPLIKLTKTAQVILPKLTADSRIKPKPIIRYVITAKNVGSSDAYDVKIADAIPGQLAYVPDSAAAGRASSDGNGALIAPTYDVKTAILTLLLPVIEPGQTESLVFDATPKNGVTMNVRNKATATYSDERAQ